VSTITKSFFLFFVSVVLPGAIQGAQPQEHDGHSHGAPGATVGGTAFPRASPRVGPSSRHSSRVMPQDFDAAPPGAVGIDVLKAELIPHQGVDSETPLCTSPNCDRALVTADDCEQCLSGAGGGNPAYGAHDVTHTPFQDTVLQRRSVSNLCITRPVAGPSCAQLSPRRRF
jgi:hypothetical protein